MVQILQDVDQIQVQLNDNAAVDVPAVANAFESMTNKKNSKILAQKEKLAADSLQVAENALSDIKATMEEASVKDLLNIFNSAVKVHRELCEDIKVINDQESEAEQKLAQEYQGKVDQMLKRITGG